MRNPDHYFGGWMEDAECYEWGKLFNAAWPDIVQGMMVKAQEIGLTQDEGQRTLPRLEERGKGSLQVVVHCRSVRD